jgi:hypothetical protein
MIVHVIAMAWYASKDQSNLKRACMISIERRNPAQAGVSMISQFFKL